MAWKIASVPKHCAISALPAVAAWMAASDAPTFAAKPASARPSRSSAFHTGCSRYSIAKRPASSSQARRRGAVAPARLCHGRFQRRPRGDAVALRRRPGGKARTQGPARVIGVRFGRRDALDAAVDAHLAFELGPHEDEARGAARLELARLAAAVVRTEGKAAALDAFQEHDARRGRAVGAYRGKCHGVGQGQARVQGVFEPVLELAYRIAISVSFAEAGAHIILTQIGDLHVGILQCETQRTRERNAISL